MQPSLSGRGLAKKTEQRTAGLVESQCIIMLVTNQGLFEAAEVQSRYRIDKVGITMAHG